MKPTIIHATAGMTIGVVGGYCLGRWRSVPDVAGLRDMRDDLLAWSRTGPRFVAINVVDVRQLTQVSEEVRKEIATVQESFADRQLGLATVIPNRGFFAAAVRGVASAVQLLSRAPFPQRVFDDVVDAAVWGHGLFGAAGDPLTPVDVVAAMEELSRP